MSSTLRRVVAALVFAWLASWAWAPAIATGLARGEFRTLAEAGALIDGGSAWSPARWYALHGADGHALAALDLLRLQRVWSDGGAWMSASAWPLRVESALLVLLAAWFIARFVRRAFGPWIGSDAARAAAWACAAVFALHPVHAASLSSLSARNELLALVFASAAGWLFLRGRHKQDTRALWGSVACAIAAGACSDVALALPAWLALAEFASGKRHRPWQTRARTAATTLCVYAAATLLDTLLRAAVLGRWSAPELSTGREGLAAATIAIERTGALLVPIDASVLGALGFAIAGVVTLAALQPVLLAARSAPRLWGWIVLAWGLALVCSELVSPSARVNTSDFTLAASLVPAALVLSIALGVASTAISGLRRIVLPLALCAGYAVLSHANAIAFRDAAAASAVLSSEFVAARSSADAQHVIALDLPHKLGGIELLDGALPWMLDARFVGGDGAARVSTATSAALVAFAREPEFSAWRAQSVVLIVPVAQLDATNTSGARVAVALASPRASGPPHEWYRESRSPTLDVDTASMGALRVRATEEALTERAPVAAWRAGEGASERLREGRCVGAWSYAGESPEAMFDLSASVAWLCAGTVEQISSAEGWSSIVGAELLAQLPQPALRAPEIADGAWSFAADTATLVGELELTGEWKLALLSLEHLQHVELDAQVAGQALRVEGAVDAASRIARAGESLVWQLERRLGGVAIERLRGRVTR